MAKAPPNIDIGIDLNIKADFSEEELAARMQIFGELIINQIKENIRNMKLIGTGEADSLLQGWFSTYTNGKLIIENTRPWMVYLEYGTYEYSKMFGLDNYPATPDPKKKDLPYRLRKQYPKGMQPFAFIRKVVYNPIIMDDLAKKSFS